MEKTLEYYMELDYPVELSKIKPEEGGGFFVSVPLLPGCMSDGDTLEEAYSNIVEAKKEWFSSMIERKMEIPEPVEKEQNSTVYAMQMLQKEMAGEAEKNGLNSEEDINDMVKEIRSGGLNSPNSVVKESFTTAADPFYSDENMARLKSSIAQMEATGGAVHEVSCDD